MERGYQVISGGRQSIVEPSTELNIKLIPKKKVFCMNENNFP